MGGAPGGWQSPPRTGGFRGGRAPRKTFLFSDFNKINKLHVSQMILRKKKKKSTKIFFAKFLFIFIESSETHFDLVVSKIGVKLNNFVIYRDILVNLSTKSTIS